MKIICIGDIHGSNKWKEIIKNEKYDRVVFVGDYFDSFEFSSEVQIENFMEIIKFKEENPENVILLIGNHDYHYTSFTNERYSGFQNKNMFLIRNLIMSAISQKMLQMCYKHEDIIFTHAGVTKTWAKENDIDVNNIEESINDLFLYKPNKFNFCGSNFYGDDITQSPIWVRPNSLKKDLLKDFRYVIGHTEINHISLTDKIIMIDVLRFCNEYLVYENGKFEIRS